MGNELDAAICAMNDDYNVIKKELMCNPLSLVSQITQV